MVGTTRLPLTTSCFYCPFCNKDQSTSKWSSFLVGSPCLPHLGQFWNNISNHTDPPRAQLSQHPLSLTFKQILGAFYKDLSVLLEGFKQNTIKLVSSKWLFSLITFGMLGIDSHFGGTAPPPSDSRRAVFSSLGCGQWDTYLLMWIKTALNTVALTYCYLAKSGKQICNVGELENKKNSDRAVPSLWLEEDRRVAWGINCALMSQLGQLLAVGRTSGLQSSPGSQENKIISPLDTREGGGTPFNGSITG